MTSDRQPTDSPTLSRRRRDTIRLTNAVPLLFAIIAGCAIAGLMVPSFREVLATSFTRQPERFITLLFGDEVDARSCEVTGGEQKINATLYSELAEARKFKWRVAVTSDNSKPIQRDGIVETLPGRSSAIQTAVAVPKSGPYRVELTLVGRSERLILQCRTPAEKPPG